MGSRSSPERPTTLLGEDDEPHPSEMLLAALGAVGAYSLTRSLAGQGPLSVSLSPAGPEVANTQLVVHADTDARYSGTGLDFTALVPAGWQQFRL